MENNLPLKIKNYISGKPYTADSIGKSGSGVYIFDDCVLKIESLSPYAEKAVSVMRHYEGRLPLPRVLCFETAGDKSFLLMSRISGTMSCDEYYMRRPRELITILAEGLNMLWAQDISDCPVNEDLDYELSVAEENIRRGLVDISHCQLGTFSEGGFASPEALLDRLRENKPPMDPVLSHGDYCLPNVFIKNGSISGFIDVGNMGVADRYRDISLCYRSLINNSDGTFGHVYDGVAPDLLFEKLGIEKDEQKLRYYILLDELF